MAMHKTPDKAELEKRFLNGATADLAERGGIAQEEVTEQPKPKAKPLRRLGAVKRSKEVPSSVELFDQQLEDVSVPVTYRIPASLKRRLLHYIDTYARRHESMTAIVVDGLEAELERRYKALGVKEGIPK